MLCDGLCYAERLRHILNKFTGNYLKAGKPKVSPATPSFKP